MGSTENRLHYLSQSTRNIFSKINLMIYDSRRMSLSIALGGSLSYYKIHLEFAWKIYFEKLIKVFLYVDCIKDFNLFMLGHLQ